MVDSQMSQSGRSRPVRVLLCGESWVSYGVHVKGFASYTTGGYAEGMAVFGAAVRAAGHELEYIPNHRATFDFPWTLDGLAAYDVVVLSDVPADTLLLHPDTFERGQRMPDRLALLGEWVGGGGGLLMIGGYMSFSGYEGKARYQGTALASVLPVEMLGYDDRVETPSGAVPVRVGEHPVTADLDQRWPALLGYNRVKPKAGATVLASCGDDPVLVVGSHGSGRTAAFTSDCSPHWAPDEFMEWPGYGRLWDQLLSWLAG